MPSTFAGRADGLRRCGGIRRRRRATVKSMPVAQLSTRRSNRPPTPRPPAPMAIPPELPAHVLDVAAIPGCPSHRRILQRARLSAIANASLGSQRTELHSTLMVLPATLLEAPDRQGAAGRVAEHDRGPDAGRRQVPRRLQGEAQAQRDGDLRHERDVERAARVAGALQPAGVRQRHRDEEPRHAQVAQQLRSELDDDRIVESRRCRAAARGMSRNSTASECRHAEADAGRDVDRPHRRDRDGRRRGSAPPPPPPRPSGPPTST